MYIVLPTSLLLTWINNEQHGEEDFLMNLHNNQNLNIPFVLLAFSSKQPLIVLPKTWQNFQNGEIKNIRNIQKFNKSLKAILLNQLSSTPSCNRLLYPVCHLQQ